MRSRVRARHAPARQNWLQLVRFGLVGASGYVVNLAVFALALRGLGVGYRTAATVAFVVAVDNNFMWNRHWTFDARRRPRRLPGRPLLRRQLLARSSSASACSSCSWRSPALAEVLAQAIAIATATPLNFIGNKLWSFRA